MSLLTRLCFLKKAGFMIRQDILKCAVLSDVINYNSLTARCKTTSSDDRVVITDDGSTIVCWHPEKPFPYECSRPLPENPTVENSVLKVQNSSDIYEVFKTKREDEVRAELMKITHTTKHRWFPNNKLFKRRKGPRDREYL